MLAILYCCFSTTCKTEDVEISIFPTINGLKLLIVEQEDMRRHGAEDLPKVQQMTNCFVYNQIYEQLEFPRGQLRIGQLLGQGAFGQVYHAIAYGLNGSESTPSEVAVKTLKGSRTIYFKFKIYIYLIIFFSFMLFVKVVIRLDY